jgi:beta-alanine degradation protein BauB
MPVESKLLLENDKVKIVEVRITPGDKLPMHTHGRYVSYAMNPAKVRATMPDGSTMIRELQKGTVAYSESGVTHSLENIGSTDVFNLDIELKD